METRWAILLCKFNDDNSEPYTRQFYERFFTAAGSGSGNLVDYFRTVSHGNADVSGSRVFGWLTLSRRRSDHTGLDTRGDLVNWARQAAAAAGIDLSPFFGVIVCLNVPADLFGLKGAVVCDSNAMEQYLLSHEMGHGYGLGHSKADGSEDHYRDPWDIMSAANTHSAAHAEYTTVGPALSAWNMRSLSWLDESRVWRGEPTGFDERVELRPLTRHDLPGLLAAELPGGYLVEFRMKEGPDSGIPVPAVLVHSFEGESSYVMWGASGRHDLAQGDSFFVGDLTRAYTRVVVETVDATARVATVRLQHRPHSNPSLGVFYRGEGDWLVWRAFSGGRWHGEEIFNDRHSFATRLGAGPFIAGGTESAPSVVSGWRGHRFAVFFRGADDRLRWKAHHAGRWHGDAAVGGGSILTSSPAVVAPGRGELASFYRSEGDWLAWRSYSVGRWHGEEVFNDRHPYPTRMSSAPAAVPWWQGHRFAVFFRGADDRLRWKAHHAGRWHGDAVIEGGGTLTSAPAVVTFGRGELGVFYRGAGDWLVWRAYSGGRWHGEEVFNDRHPYPTRMKSAPTVVSEWRGHKFAVFFRGHDDRLRWKAHHGGRWHADAVIEGGGLLTSRPEVAAFLE